MKKNNQPKLRILMFLHEHKGECFQQSKIAKLLDLNYSTISKHTKILQKDGYVRINRAGNYRSMIMATMKLTDDEDKKFIWKYI